VADAFGVANSNMIFRSSQWQQQTLSHSSARYLV